MINCDNLATFTPENIHRLAPLARLGGGKVRAMTWIDHETLAVATTFGLWHYRLEGSGREIVGFDDDHRPLVFTENAKFFLVWDENKTLNIHDSRSGELIRSASLAFYPAAYHGTDDGRFLAYFDNLHLHVFDMVENRKLSTFVLPKIFDILFSTDEQLLLVLIQEEIVYFDFKRNELVQEKRVEDETRLIEHWLGLTQEHVILRQRKSYRVIPFNIPAPVQHYDKNSDWFNDLTQHIVKHSAIIFFRGKQTLVGYSFSNVIYVSDTETKHNISIFTGMVHQILRVNQDASAMAILNDRDELMICVRENSEKYSLRYLKQRTSAHLIKSHHHQIVAYNTKYGIDTVHLHVHHWKINQQIIEKTIRLSNEMTYSKMDRVAILFTHDDKYLIYTYGFDNRFNAPTFSEDEAVVSKIDLKTEEEKIFLTIPTQRRLYFAPNGDWYAVTVQGEGVSIFETATQQLRYMILPDAPTGFIEFSPDNRYLLLIGWRSCELWDLENNCGIGRFGISSCGFSPNSRMIAYITEKSLVIWNIHHRNTHVQFVLESSTETDILMAIKGVNLVFSPDSRLIAFAQQNELVIWNIEEKQLHARLEIEYGTELIFSPDSRLLFALRPAFGEMKVWDVEAKICLSTFEDINFHWGQGKILFHEDMNLLALGLSDGTVALWGIRGD